jgi:isoamylase
LIAFRKAHHVFSRDSFVPTKGGREFSLNWHGTSLSEPNWNSGSHWLALHLSEAYAGKELDHIYLMTNAYWEPISFALPRVEGWHWCRVVDTSLAAPLDIVDPGHEQKLTPQDCYLLQPRSTVVLLGKREAA